MNTTLPVSTESNVPTVDGVQPDVAPNNLRTTVGGVQGILSIQASVAAGTTNYDSAISMLTILYGFDDVEARSLLGQPKPAPVPATPNQ